LKLPYELFLALRYLRFHRGHTFLSIITLISVAGVTVGTAALVIALSLMAGMVQDVRERIHSGSAHLTLLSASSADVFQGADELVQRLEAVPGVSAAAPVLYTPAMLSFAETSSHGFAELHGIDVAAHSRVILDRDLSDGPFAALARGSASGRDGILLGAGLAAKLGVIEGDLVRALVPSVTLTPWGATPRNRVYEVVGSYRSDHFQEDTLRAYVDIRSARQLQRAQDASSWIELRVEDLGRLAPMKAELQRRFSPGWFVVDLLEQNRDLLRALRMERLLLFLAIGLIVIVAALNIVSTLILMVTDKIKEIGTLSALGARPVEIARVFMLQGSVIGVVGTTSGLLLGSVICWGLDRYEVIKLNPEVYYLTHVPFQVQPLDLLFVGTAALLVSFVATLYPAFKAASLDPVEALRYE
jgi:lipoprotein-releasing system permease protein